MKRKILWHRVIIAIIITILLIMSLNAILGTNKRRTNEIGTNTRVEAKVSVNSPNEEETPRHIREKFCSLEFIECNFEDEEIEYRLTSYYTGDSTNSGSWVGAGINTSKFQVNEKGWYTYKNKLVLAGATNECLNSTSGACGEWNIPKTDKHYYNYYDEITIIIDEVEYEGIILDSCGACMYLDENRIDLFVSKKENAIDRGYQGVNMIKVVS